MKFKPAFIALLAVGLLAGCSQVNPGTQAIEKDSWGSPTLGNCDVGPANPGTSTVDLIRFPARQITWDATGDQGSEAPPYAALSKPASPPLAPGQVPDADFSTGQAEMAIPVTLTFDLTQNCDDLKEFYTKYATKDNGWLDDNGNSTDGWIKLLNYTISQPAQQAIIRITQKYPWQKVWNDETVRAEYQKDLTADLQKEAATRTGGKEYFTNFLVTVGKPYPTDQALRDAVAAQQSSQAQANATQTKATADANARKASAQADTDAANAEVNAKAAEANKQRAIIDGFGGLDGYLRYLCITTQGCTMYGPSPIIAGAPAH
jgi:hypothetical protein